MSKELLIVFVKNIKLGKVKTRLAATIGDQAAFTIYKELVEITENVTKNSKVDQLIYFSDVIIDNKWKGTSKAVQKGVDLGERMKNAFIDGFQKGYKKIILIGSDLPDISEKIIKQGFEKLATHDVVFGPAEDGGYYLIGLSKMNASIFENKPWSQSKLLKVTLQGLESNNQKINLLETFNDIDTFEDLKESSFYKNSIYIQELVKNKID